MKPRWLACMVMNLVLLSSCGTSDQPKDERKPAAPTPAQVDAAQQEADKIVKQQMANLQKKEASTFPCSVFAQQEIEALAGNPLDKGSYAFNNVSENDHDYKSESCDWSAKGGDGNEVNLWVSLPKHFASGKVECSPGDAAKKISGIGEEAWWDYQKYFGMGTLRVCSAKAMLEVKATAKGKDEAVARHIAQTVAGKILASSLE